MSPRVSVGVSLKMYFGHADARRWFERVAELAAAHPAVADGRVECFVLHVQRRVGSHRETVAESLLHALGTDADEHHLAALGFLDPERFLDRELVVGRHDPGLDVRLGNRRPARGDAHSGFGVRDLLDANGDLHAPPS